MASAADKLKKSSNGGIPAVATVQAPRTAGVGTLSVDTQQFWPTTTGVSFATYKVDANNAKIAGTQIDWSGVSNGTNSVTGMVRVGGAADSGNAIGDKVQMMVTAQWGEDVIENILTQHNQDGTHGAVTAVSVTTSGDITAGGNLVVSGTLTVAGINVSSRFAQTGEITMFGAASAPTGWLLCDGTAVNRSTYAALFALIGTTYGVGDGTTTFNVPNFKGKTPFGMDSGQSEFVSLATAGGQKTVQQHNHGISDPGHAHLLWSVGQEGNSYPLSGPSTRVVLIGGNPEAGNGTTGHTGTGISVNNAGSGGNNLNPYLTVNFIIKT